MGKKYKVAIGRFHLRLGRSGVQWKWTHYQSKTRYVYISAQECDEEAITHNRIVTNVVLDENELTGPIPIEFGLLVDLSYIDFCE